MLEKFFQEIRQLYDWRLVYILFALVAGVYTFFLNPAILESYRQEWLSDYYEFSRTLYQPQQTYFSESILLPWVALLLGASKHWLFYKIFGSFLNLLLLPVIAYAVIRYFNDAAKSWCFIIIFLFTFRYIWQTFYLGFPDPVTIMLLAAVALQRQPLPLFFLVLLAALSHFSMTLIGLSAFAMLLITAPGYTKQYKFTLLKYVGVALILGKILLTAWFYRFSYIPYNRLNWAIDHGLASFISRYQADVWGFWLTPGVNFLYVFGFSLGLALAYRNVLFALVMCLTLALSYLALFFTIDGLRVFAVVIVAPYVFIIRTVIEQTFQRFKQSRTTPPTTC